MNFSRFSFVIPLLLATPAMGAGTVKIREPLAVVNGVPITASEVDARIALYMLANETSLTFEQRLAVQPTVMRDLVDELIKIQAAATQNMPVDVADVDQVYHRIARDLNRTPEQLDRWLRSNGASPATLRQQIRAELAWSNLVARRYPGQRSARVERSGARYLRDLRQDSEIVMRTDPHR